MTIKKIFIIILLLFSISLVVKINAQSESELQQKINEYQTKLTEIRQQKNTLSSQIQYMDTQIYLTTLQIQSTEQKIINTGKEIDLLGTRIEGLDTSLDYLSKLLINKIVEGYKKRETNFLAVLFNTKNADDFLNKVKYLKSSRDNNQKLLVQVQEAKSNAEEQKLQREEKKVELTNLTQILNSQKIALNSQRIQKENLLAATKNSEGVYQDLLTKAQAELSGFRSFVQSAGGGLTSFGSGSNGWYFTQRDPQWGNIILPGSSSSVMLAGCAVTSVAMVCRSYGQGTSPADIANNSGNFIGGDLWNWAFSCSGKTTEWIGSSEDQVKSYINNNIPVILRLYAPSVSGLHFIVAWKLDGGDFIIHDPYYGPDKKFSERYTWSQVTTAIAIH